MRKVVYLFGAGASCKSLPLVKDMPNRMKDFIIVLEEEEFKLSEGEFFQNLQTLTKEKLQNKMIADLKWLVEESTKHASIDTFAKKLYLKGKDVELSKLKNGLSAFMTYEQIKSKPDFRYDSFFASILKSRATDFPKNIRIVSWNYDYQFELSYMEYSDDHRMWASQHSLNVLSKYDRKSNPINGFGMFKINGSAGLASDNFIKQYYFVENFKDKISKSLIDQLVHNYTLGSSNNNGVVSTLSFAWEDEYREPGIKEEAISNFNDAETLIIIGYSFPFFNITLTFKLMV